MVEAGIAGATSVDKVRRIAGDRMNGTGIGHRAVQGGQGIAAVGNGGPGRAEAGPTWQRRKLN
jgi:hypothetical protein